MLTSLLIVFVCILLGAIFSASESAILSVSQAKIYKLKCEGNANAAIVQKLYKDKENVLGAILFGNNLSTIASSALAADLSIELFGDGGWPLIVSTIIMTLITVLYCELLPKTYAVKNAESLSLLIARPLLVFTSVCSPMIRVAKKILYYSAKIIPAKNSADQIQISALDTIKSTIDIHYQEGEVITDYKKMLGGVIDLEEIIVEEVMVHRNNIYSLNVDMSVVDILKGVTESKFSRIPVWQNEEDNIIGFLHVKDISKLCVRVQDIEKITHLDLHNLVRAPWFIPNMTNLRNQMMLFRQRHEHFAFVVNEYGELEGLLTLEDIMEEIVGDIEDEHDSSSIVHIEKESNNSVIVTAEVTIRDLNREMEWDIDDDEANTIGGLLFHLAMGVPKKNSEFTSGNYTLKLLHKKQNTLLKIKVIKHELE